MISKRITGTTHNLGVPENWDPEVHGNCVHLPVRVSVFGNTILCESAWEPTPEELRLLNAGGSIVLGVVGKQPPVNLRVEPVNR